MAQKSWLVLIAHIFNNYRLICVFFGQCQIKQKKLQCEEMKLHLLFPSLPPHGHIWDVMLVGRKRNIEKNCLCVTVLCTIIMVHKGTSGQPVSGFDLAWFSSLSSKHHGIFGLHGAIYIIFFCLYPSLYLLVSWACWDWFMMWLTNHHPSVLWHCWLGHLSHKLSPKWPIMCRVGR